MIGPRAAGPPRVVAILPRGEAIRNFVYSGALDELGARAEVHLLTVLPNAGIEALLRERYGRVRELQEIGERWCVRAARELLEQAHGRWLGSEAARERLRLRAREATTHGARLKRWAKATASLPFANRPGLAVLSGIERGLSRLLRTTDEYLAAFRDLRPDLVFNGSHIHSRNAIQAVQAARWLKIPTAAFLFSWDNLTSQGRILPRYDHYLVWNEAIKEQLLAMYPGTRADRVHVTGSPQFDFHFRPEFRWSRAEFCARVGADPVRPIVLYSTGMANHMPDEPALVEGIADRLARMTDHGPPQLLLRVYPKDRTGRFQALQARRPEILVPDIPWEPNWLTPEPEDAALYTSTLLHVALGINVASTVSLELCLFDKPVINVGYNPPRVSEEELSYARYYRFDHYRPIVESGAVQVADSEDRLAALLADALLTPARHAEARRALVRGFFGDSLDGRCSTRVAAALGSLVHAP